MLKIVCTGEKGKINKSWIGKIYINNYKTEIKLNTGAELNFNALKLKNVSLRKGSDIIRSFVGFMTKSLGSILVELKNDKIKCTSV